MKQYIIILHYYYFSAGDRQDSQKFFTTIISQYSLQLLKIYDMRDVNHRRK